MEFLLFVQPIGEILLPIILVLCSLGLVGSCVAYVCAAGLYYKKTYDDGWVGTGYDDEELARRKLDSATAYAIGKKFSTLLLASALMLLPVITAAQGWEIFKNMVIYQVATSDTADKAIDNTNLLMDKLNEFIDDWDPKAKVEAVEEAVKEVAE